jgi:hypothetical protein
MNTNIKVAIDELHKAFNVFNENLFSNELPEPAILIQNQGNRKNILGWCSTQQIWVDKKNEITKYEINIVAERLNRPLFEIMSTLLHEMVHLYNLTHDIKDVSRAGTYHNKTFKKMGERFGLIIDKAPKIGWSVSRLQESTKDLIVENGINEDAFTLSRRSNEKLGGGSSRKTSSRKYRCPICGNSVRATKDLLVICGVCNVPYEKEKKEDENEDGEEDNESEE